MSFRQTRNLCVVAAAAALIAGGCTTAEPVGPAATQAKAIRIAKERCKWTMPFERTQNWRAALHQGQWHVWLSTDRDPREPVVGTLDIWIRASDGAAGACNHT